MKTIFRQIQIKSIISLRVSIHFSQSVSAVAVTEGARNRSKCDGNLVAYKANTSQIPVKNFTWVAHRVLIASTSEKGRRRYICR